MASSSAPACLVPLHFRRPSPSSSPLLSSSIPSRFVRSSTPSLRLGVSAVMAAAEQVTLESGGEEVKNVSDSTLSSQTVSVPVSQSDVLTMFFKAEGTMDEFSISTVSSALQEVEGVSDLKVQILEGIASIELTKQTTVQATGVASNLVEVIQGSGFKLQTLNLSFHDEQDI